MKNRSVFLRAFEEGDHLLINKWRNDYNIQKNTGGPVRFVSSEMEKEWVKDKMMHNQTDMYWAICLNDDTRRMVGYISLNKIDHLNKAADAGGTVIGEREFQDGVIVFEALSIMLEYAFGELNMNRISACCLPEHPFAPYSLLSFGFKNEGRRREAVYKGGRYHDLLDFALLRRDYEEIEAAAGYEITALIKRFRDCIKNKTL